MNETIEINGVTYSRDEINEVINKFKDAVVTVANVLNKIKDVIISVVQKAIEYFKYIASIIHLVPGFRRLVKMDQLKQYEEMSVDKSNNWRRIHGLKVKRRYGE
ncbi:hypothetical protein [Schinkia azotoformans]|uniref:hypothetical protein n=1 Tax=Schinkia azotoformans TaxID=1454 RepID=UPI002DB9F40D|nr:hypothetical protein [Schinkia azotoformans]MEC1768295.1 hypothetical protein [Schinkia azotoformans]